MTMNNANRRLIFLDEVGFNYTMRTHSGRSRRNTKAQKHGPAFKSRNITVMAAISNDRLIYYEVLDGPGNNVAFTLFIDDLARERDIQGLPPNSIIVMENVAFHRNELCREIMEIRGFEYKIFSSI